MSSSRSMRGTASCTVFSPEIIDERPGQLIFEVEDKQADKLFVNESGGHRWQRVPPTEKHGRRQTSTVTVAVLTPRPRQDWGFDEREIEWSAIRGSGKGGQAKQKTSNCVVMRHPPSGIVVRVENSRSQWQNRQSALAILSAKLYERQLSLREGVAANERREKIGSGQRGDKIRTIRLQDDQVVDHQTGKRMKAGRYMKGYVNELH